MATYPIPTDVYIKGPLTVGADLAPTKIKATLHLEQSQGETRALAHFARTVGGGSDSVGLKIDLPGEIPNLQGLSATSDPGPLALNQQGGNLQLGSAASQVSVPGNLSVAGTVNGRILRDDGVKLHTHVANMNNPHGVTADQIGALPLSGGALTGALTVQGDLTVQGTTNGRVLVADGAKLDSHVANTHNPHAVTAGQVGALPASGGEITGALTVLGELTVGGRKLTADRAKLDSHVNATNNPHSVTALQIGALPLSGGTLTGALTVQGDLITTGAGAINGRNVAADGRKLDAHVADKQNPHGTTAAQIGALALSGGTLAGTLAIQGSLTTSGTINGRNMGADGSRLDAHLASHANPHAVTANQVGALPTTGGTLTGSLQVQGNITATGAVNGRNIGADGSKLDAHLTHRDNPHSVSAAQIGALPTTGGTLTGNLSIRAGLGDRWSAATFWHGHPQATWALLAIVAPDFNSYLGTGRAAVAASSAISGVYGVYATAPSGTHALYVNGTAQFTGSKSGYVVDRFVNSSGQRLHTGDLVKLKGTPIAHFYGDNNKIPVAEVTLADTESDCAVIGVVDREAIPEPDAPDTRIEPDDPTCIEDGGELFVVTLGAYAHCKVDATTAPIAVGDLLTTADKSGYAKKAVNPKTGSIIGKAMEPLNEGTGYIAVFVNIQ